MNKSYKLGYQHAYEQTGYDISGLINDSEIEEYNEGYNQGEMKINEINSYYAHTLNNIKEDNY